MCGCDGGRWEVCVRIARVWVLALLELDGKHVVHACTNHVIVAVLLKLVGSVVSLFSHMLTLHQLPGLINDLSVYTKTKQIGFA